MYPGGRALGVAAGGAMAVGGATGAGTTGGETSGVATVGTTGAAVGEGTPSAVGACSSAIIVIGKDMSAMNPTTNFRMTELLKNRFIED
jgi:hypothetical protein